MQLYVNFEFNGLRYIGSWFLKFVESSKRKIGWGVDTSSHLWPPAPSQCSHILSSTLYTHQTKPCSHTNTYPTQLPYTISTHPTYIHTYIHTYTHTYIHTHSLHSSPTHTHIHTLHNNTHLHIHTLYAHTGTRKRTVQCGRTLKSPILFLTIGTYHPFATHWAS